MLAADPLSISLQFALLVLVVDPMGVHRPGQVVIAEKRGDFPRQSRVIITI